MMSDFKFDKSNVAEPPHFITVRYLEEARTCLESGAFRMSIIASACALNFGLAFMLRRRGLIPNEAEVPNLNNVIERIWDYIYENPITVLSEIPLDKCDKIRHWRNAFVHPEDFLILKQNSKKINYFTLVPKKKVSKDKENAWVASQYDKKKELKAMAEESLDIAYNSIREQLEKLMLN